MMCDDMKQLQACQGKWKGGKKRRRTTTATTKTASLFGVIAWKGMKRVYNIQDEARSKSLGG